MKFVPDFFKNAPPSRWLQLIFWLYLLFLSFLLIVHNPFAYVPIDEELAEKGFGLSLSPHVLSFLLLAVLGLCARFRHPGRLYFGLFLYAGLTELLQGALHPWLGRYCDLIDFADNVQGLLYGGLGWWISNAAGRFFRKGTDPAVPLSPGAEEEKRSEQSGDGAAE